MRKLALTIASPLDAFAQIAGDPAIGSIAVVAITLNAAALTVMLRVVGGAEAAHRNPVLQLVTVLMTTLGRWAITSAVLWLMVAAVRRQSARTLVSAVIRATIPTVILKPIVVALLTVYRVDLRHVTLAHAMPPIDLASLLPKSMPIFVRLAGVDFTVFDVWSIVLIAIALHVIYAVSRTRAAMFAVLVALLEMAYKVAVAVAVFHRAGISPVLW